MGRIIDRRRVMGGKSLPYDAEIEYLESSGTQWIETDIVPNTRLSYTIILQRLDTGIDDEIPFGSRNSMLYDYSLWTNPSSNKGIAAHYADGNRGRIDTGWVYTGDIVNSFHTVEVSNYNVIVDGTAVFTFPNIRYEVGIHTLSIFALNNANMHDNRTFKGRIKKVVIALDGTVVRDYITVRVGQVGYMYDKVSKQLFGNAGTGEFILGPDKNSVTIITQQQQEEMYG